MPIDGHSYLTKRGWAGKGSGLRAGSVARPIVASQKRDSRGLGKDRDDHFEFWDHVYAAAATTIKINVSTEEEQGECDRLIGLEEEPRGPQRTSSGLVSTQRSSKLKRVSRPGGDEAAAATIAGGAGEAARGDSSLLTIAKREAARRMLYSKFYRGEVLRGEYEETVVVGPEDGFGGERKRERERERKKKRKREARGDEEHHQKRKKRKQKGKEKALESGGVIGLSRPSDRRDRPDRDKS